jgi:hypothetical protein
MGYSLSWLAIRGIAYPRALELQSLRLTEQTADYAEHPTCGMQDAGGWSLVVARGCDHRIVSADNLVTLSLECEVIACSIEEHVMVSTAEHWLNGVRQWRVEHDAQRSIDHLATCGSLPADFAATRDRFATQQEAEGGEDAEADYYFEIPLVLAQARVGFKHDEGAAFNTDGRFRVLEDLAPKKAWWRFWA